MNNASPQIIVPAQPRRLRFSQDQVWDYVCQPAMAASVILKLDLDVFQQNALTIGLWTPNVMDSSGYSSSKTFRMWCSSTLRGILIEDHHSLVAYPSFSTGQKSFWEYFGACAARSEVFRAHMGKARIVGLDGKTQMDSKAQSKGPSCYEFYFQNGSKTMLPAVGFLQDARNLASLRINDLYVDEHTKAEASGSTGIDDQLVGRATRDCFNQHHPFWSNHLYFAATAEDTMHPTYERYKTFMNEVRKGNPKYFHLSYCYKDVSELPCGNSGRSFKDKLRVDSNIAHLKKTKTPSSFRQEGLGIWSKNGRGWYTQDAIDRAILNGTERGILPMVSRHEDYVRDKSVLENVHYFLGGDPARAATAKADDGTLVVLRAQPRIDHPTGNLEDWYLDYVWSMVIRGADAGQWSGIIHRKHKQFGFSGLILDAGAGGGGEWIRPELAKPQQVIRNQIVKVRPIGLIEDEMNMIEGDLLLSMFRRGDQRIKGLWPDLNMRGEDIIIEAAHKEFKEAWDNGHINLPPKLSDLKRSVTEGWSEERRKALTMLHRGAKQLTKVSYKTNDDGTPAYNSHNALEFSAKGKKDLGYSMLYAFVRFLMWVKTFEAGLSSEMPSDCAAGCG